MESKNVLDHIFYTKICCVLLSCVVYHLEVNHFLLLRVEQMKYIKC